MHIYIITLIYKALVRRNIDGKINFDIFQMEIQRFWCIPTDGRMVGICLFLCSVSTGVFTFRKWKRPKTRTDKILDIYFAASF